MAKLLNFYYFNEGILEGVTDYSGANLINVLAVFKASLHPNFLREFKSLDFCLWLKKKLRALGHYLSFYGLILAKLL